MSIIDQPSASSAPSARGRLTALVCVAAACMVGLVSGTAVAQKQEGLGTQTGQSGVGTGPASSSLVTVEQCLTAVGQSSRSATFAAQMTAVAGTARMAVRIDVQERSPAEAGFHTLSAPGLGVWRRSTAGVKIYKYLRQVTNLPAPASFRALVRFRWYNSQGHVIKHVERRTPICEQPDERAKLVIGQVKVLPLGGKADAPGMAAYQVTVRNEGRSATVPFAATLTFNGGVQAYLNAPALAAGTRAVLYAQAPVCTTGSLIEVQLDPKHQVEEASGGGLTDMIPCPLG